MTFIRCQQVRRNNFHGAVQLLVLLPPDGCRRVGATRSGMFRLSRSDLGLVDRQACFAAVQGVANSFAT
ncbi:hypothetical protein [Aurantimonas coralicida]|uniref:hypothetical protein n=1 Tax=Aurantimonas coralicida TaxID=182270 RepID=UPI001D192E9F|nr:hypothetical protein [Aurantimonas coralicida]MCC4296110.1 hypothetical protein [Aurantimonas coralicida]